MATKLLQSELPTETENRRATTGTQMAVACLIDSVRFEVPPLKARLPWPNCERQARVGLASDRKR